MAAGTPMLIVAQARISAAKDCKEFVAYREGETTN